MNETTPPSSGKSRTRPARPPSRNEAGRGGAGLPVGTIPVCIVKLAAHRKLKASEEEVEALIDALLEDGDGDRGLNLESCGCGLFVFSENLDFDSRETAPKKFLTLLGRIIRNNGLDYLSLGESITRMGVHVGSERGGEVRIKADGSIWDPTLIWEEESNIQESNAQ